MYFFCGFKNIMQNCAYGCKIVVSLLSISDKIESIQTIYKITKLFKKPPCADWKQYFIKYLSELTVIRKKDKYIEFSEKYPNVSNNFTFGFNKNKNQKINSRWYRTKCHRLYFSLTKVMEYCCDEYNNGMNKGRCKTALMNELRKDTSDFDVRICKSIKYNPGNDDGTLCEKDMAYGYDGINWWFIYTLQVGLLCAIFTYPIMYNFYVICININR